MNKLLRFIVVLWLLVLGLSGCSTPNTIASGLATKSNNASVGVTGIKISAYDAVTGLPTVTLGSAHGSFLSRRDGQPAQVSIHNSYSWVPGDTSLSASDIAINFGRSVSKFSVVYSGSTAAIQFSEHK